MGGSSKFRPGTLQKEIYQVLRQAEEPITVREVAEQVGREPEALYTPVRRLVELGRVVEHTNGGPAATFAPARRRRQRTQSTRDAKVERHLRALERLGATTIDKRPGRKTTVAFSETVKF